MSLPSAADFESLLKVLLTPDTNAIRQAMDTLNLQLKQPASMIVLMELIQKSQFAEIRQLAAVVMRKKIVGHWIKLKADVQENVKAILLEMLVKEPTAPVRKAVLELAAVIGRILLPTGQWKELFDFLLKATQSNLPEHRELAYSLFESLIQNIGENIRSQFIVLQKLFAQGLQDSEGRVRVAALKATGAMVQYLSTDEEVISFQELLPSMFTTIKLCLQHGLEEDAVTAFEVFDDLLELPLPVVAGCVPDLIKFALEVASVTSVETSVRQQALTLVEWAALYKPKALTKNNLIGPILEVVFPLCAEPETESKDEEDDEEMSWHKFAAHLVDTLALHVPSKHIFLPAMTHVGNYLSSQSAHQRRAAMISLAMISEGCAEPMTESPDTLNKLLQMIYTAATDADQAVREASCIALGQFSTHLMPDISRHYQQVLPLLFKSLDDPTEKVRMGSCYALEAFCQNLSPQEILPFLEPLLTKLIEVLHKGNTKVQDIAISAISSTAAAAGKAFLPFADTLLKMMKQLMMIDSDGDLLLRCRATEAAGLIAVAIGRDSYMPYFQDLMDLALRGCAIEDAHELREYTYGFFGNMAEILKGDFQRYLPIVMPLLLASCNSSDGIASTPIMSNEVEGLESDEDEEEEVSLTVRTAFLDEKSSACHIIGIIAEQTGAVFVPYIDSIMKTFDNLKSYFHEYVRQEVFTSMRRMIIAVNTAFPPAKPWEPALPAEAQQLNPNTAQLVNVVIPILVNAIQTDDDKATVVVAGEQLEAIIDLLGPACIYAHLPTIGTAITTVLKRKATCQQHEEEDDQDDQDLDVQVIDITLDLVIKMAKLMGPYFDSAFQELYPFVVKYYQSKTHADTYRSLAIGCLAEVCNALGPVCGKYVDPLAQICFRAMNDPDPETRSNSIFFCGILMFHGGASAVPYYNNALLILSNLFSDTALPNIVDNCCATVARMIIANAAHVPLAQVLPVLLKALPLRIDFEENKTVYPCIFHLFKSSNEVLGQNLSAAVACLARALVSANFADEYRVEVAVILRSLVQQYPPRMEQIFNELQAEEKAAIHKAISS